MSEYERYKEWFRTELELDILALDHPTEKETLDGILDILAETCSTNRKMIRIARDDKPKEVVKAYWKWQVRALEALCGLEEQRL